MKPIDAKLLAEFDATMLDLMITNALIGSMGSIAQSHVEISCSREKASMASQAAEYRRRIFENAKNGGRQP